MYVFSFDSGPSLIDYLDNLPSMAREVTGPLRLPIVDRYKVSFAVLVQILENYICFVILPLEDFKFKRIVWI